MGVGMGRRRSGSPATTAMLDRDGIWGEIVKKIVAAAVIHQGLYM
jgi:hypothetical protein